MLIDDRLIGVDQLMVKDRLEALVLPLIADWWLILVTVISVIAGDPSIHIVALVLIVIRVTIRMVPLTIHIIELGLLLLIFGVDAVHSCFNIHTFLFNSYSLLLAIVIIIEVLEAILVFHEVGLKLIVSLLIFQV